jgi:hypothetical protein
MYEQGLLVLHGITWKLLVITTWPHIKGMLTRKRRKDGQGQVRPPPLPPPQISPVLVVGGPWFRVLECVVVCVCRGSARSPTHACASGAQGWRTRRSQPVEG